jgi:pSer/pThr/pTyr-binding forkhead associated (FHA) protein
VKLSVLKKNHQAQKIDLSQEVLTFDYSETIFLIGRSKECHVILDDKQVSREHSKFIHRNGKWFVEIIAEDSQELLLNGESIKNAEVNVGDVLSIGQFSINIEMLSEEIPKDVAVTNPPIMTAPKVVVIEKIVEVPIRIEPEKVQENSSSRLSNQEVTREIDTHDLTAEIELPGLNQEEVSKDSMAPLDDVQFDDVPNENLSGSMDIKIENEANVANMGTDVNASYSLENIDESDNGSDKTKVIQSFAAVHLELFGDTAPYDKFALEKENTYIGRDPAKCQIILNDGEVSSVHALIKKNNIMVTLEDLNSANGTMLNGQRVNKSALTHNDEFIIGGVTFTVKFRSEFLAEENKRLMPVEENQTVEVEEIIEVPAEEGENINAFGEIEAEAPKEKSIIKRILKDDQLRKKVIYGIVVLVGAWFMFDDDKPKPPANKSDKKVEAADSKKKNEISSDLNKGPQDGKKIILTQEQRRKCTEYYQMGKNHFDSGRYREALEEFDKINILDPYFNNSLPTMTAAAKEGLKRLEEQERKRREEELIAERKLKISKLLGDARKYTNERNRILAEDAFQKILTLDPENFEVAALKRELNAWETEKNKKELEETQKKAERNAKVSKLSPGKSLYLAKDWYRAISKLEDFLKISPMDEDLIREATEMLKTSKEEITAAVSPLLGKAKSLQEGQDLKGAYEVYQQVLKYEPSNSEAINQINEIKETLTIKARKVYREAIISESLSLFQDAKEKYQEVQQVSPVDSEYYKKATDKLKDYLE